MDKIEFRIPFKTVKPGDIGKSPLGLAVRKNKITKRLKLKKDVRGSIPGDAGGCSVLSSRLDKLIELDTKEQKRNARFIRGSVGAIGGGLVGSLVSSFHPDVETYNVDRELKRDATKNFIKDLTENPNADIGESEKIWKSHFKPAFDEGAFGSGERASRFIENRALRGKKIQGASILGGAILGASALALRTPKSNKNKTKNLSSKLDELLLNDPRPRNNLGEFSPHTEGVADPNSMAKTYVQPAKKVAGTGSALLAGGALGAIGGAAGKDTYGAIKKLLSKKPKV